jgi:hypothetical protein
MVYVSRQYDLPDATMQSLKDLNRTVCDEVGKAAFAQPAQPHEQDGCPVCGSDVHDRDALDKAEREIERLNALVAQPQQGASLTMQDIVCPLCGDMARTWPKKERTWIALTDEEALECWPGLAMYADCAKFWENIEAKLKEKNDR